MPVACPWKRRVLAALAGLAVTLAGMPSRLCADQLVLCFAGVHLESGRRLRPEGVHVLHSNTERDLCFAFAAADDGTGVKGCIPDDSSEEKPEANADLAVAALILLVGDVPTMPQTELSDPGISGLTTGGGSTSGGSRSPSATPEPTAFLSCLLGFGLTGAYLLSRRLKQAHINPKRMPKAALA